MRANLTLGLASRLAVSLAESVQAEVRACRILRRRASVEASAMLWLVVRDCRDFLAGLPRSERTTAIETMRAACQAWREVEARKAAQ